MAQMVDKTHKNEGWGFALLICALTAFAWFSAYTYHKKSYRNPRDPMMQQTFEHRQAGH